MIILHHDNYLNPNSDFSYVLDPEYNLYLDPNTDPKAPDIANILYNCYVSYP